MVDRTTQRAAMVFSHHPHEVFATGLILEHHPHVLFLSHSHGDQRLDQRARDGLSAIGFWGTVNFLDVSEQTAYARMIEGDFAWFQSMRDQVASWLLRVRPRVVYTDAFELYNPIHDLCSLMVDSVLRTVLSPRRDAIPERFEFPLAFGAIPGAIIEESDDPGQEVIAYELTEEQIRMKRLRADLFLRDVPVDEKIADHPSKVISGMHPDLLRREFIRPVPLNRDYSTPPVVGQWTTYDEHGRERVRSGRFAKALTFAEHFAPMARSLFETSDVSVVHDEVA